MFMFEQETIIDYQVNNLLNQRNETISKRRHNKFKLMKHKT